MTDWQPIDTAPTDGTSVLLYIPDAGLHGWKIAVGRCGITGNRTKLWIIGGLFGFDVGNPSYWMPLPQPPEDTTP